MIKLIKEVLHTVVSSAYNGIFYSLERIFNSCILHDLLISSVDVILAAGLVIIRSLIVVSLNAAIVCIVSPHVVSSVFIVSVKPSSVVSVVSVVSVIISLIERLTPKIQFVTYGRA